MLYLLMVVCLRVFIITNWYQLARVKDSNCDPDHVYSVSKKILLAFSIPSEIIAQKHTMVTHST